MDEQQLLVTLKCDEVSNMFLRLCRFFGGGGSDDFWTAVCTHNWEDAATLCDEYPVVPQRTRHWLNRDAGQAYLADG